jgi:hypothetical protein
LSFFDVIGKCDVILYFWIGLILTQKLRKMSQRVPILPIESAHTKIKDVKEEK